MWNKLNNSDYKTQDMKESRYAQLPPTTSAPVEPEIGAQSAFILALRPPFPCLIRTLSYFVYTD